MKKICLLLVVWCFASGYGCSSGGGNAAEESGVAAAVEHVDTDTETLDMDSGVDVDETQMRKIVYDGRMGLEVDDLRRGKARVDSLVLRFGAYYGSEAYAERYRSVEYDLRVRIPAVRFGAFVAAVEGTAGGVKYKNIEARDVTEQYVDIRTRLDNKRQVLTRYRELLKQARSVEEILKIESYVRTLEEEIDSAEGRLRLLASQTDYGTLDLNISQQAEPVEVPADRFWHKVGRALSSGWNGLKGFVLGLLYLWPLWVVGGAALLVIFGVRRKK